MKIEGLSWSEIQDIKEGIELLKEKEWLILAKLIKNKPFEEIKKIRKVFDEDNNCFRKEGRYNHILLLIQQLDDKLKDEVKK